LTTISEIREDDALTYLQLRTELDRQSRFLLLEPGERTTTEETMKEYIRQILQRSNQMVFLAKREGTIVGFLSAMGGTVQRNKRTATIVVGILEAYTGKGIGKSLFWHMEQWAKERGIHRLDLGCMAHNARAYHLYRSLGFIEEGRKKAVYFVDGVYMDEIIMGKILES
jgi:RimJ/RimL family protein N-acetyltransferase